MTDIEIDEELEPGLNARIALSVGPVHILVAPEHVRALRTIGKHAIFAVDTEDGQHVLKDERLCGLAFALTVPKNETKENTNDQTDVSTRH